VVVSVLTSPPIFVIKGQVDHCSYVQHCMEMFLLHIYLLIVFMQHGRQLVENHPGGQGIVCRCGVTLLALPFDLAKFLVDHPRPGPEPLSACRALLVELGLMTPKAAPSPTSLPDDPK
jgi:hypothetical protein